MGGGGGSLRRAMGSQGPTVAEGSNCCGRPEPWERLGDGGSSFRDISSTAESESRIIDARLSKETRRQSCEPKILETLETHEAEEADIWNESDRSSEVSEIVECRLCP